MDARLLVRSLKGSQAQILWAFFFAMRSMDVDEVISWTGLKRETCYHALKGLEAIRLLGVQTVAHGRKVWLLGSEMLPILRDIAGQIGAGKYLSEPVELLGLQESTKGTPGDVNVVVDDLSLNSPTITTITTTSSQESTKRTPAEWSSLKVVLDEYQIIGKKRTDLIACDWVNADYVLASVKHAENERCWDNPVGMAITRMLEHVEVSHVESLLDQKIRKLRSRDEPEDHDSEEARLRYVTGKYSDYIEY